MSEAKIISQRIVYAGKKITVREDRVLEPGGHGESLREIVVHPGAVCIVAGLAIAAWPVYLAPAPM